ncbi:MAG: hypothetical protein QJR03_12130 [Sphaerobacter sp.]|nr:hypothetical protein [Sphaerobacter sp.]
MSEPRTFEEAVDLVLADMRRVMIERQRKYGPDNIRMFGEKGVVIRCHDKLARLAHFHFGGGTDASDESIDDSWIDTGNYAAIALMLRRGWWGLPLSDEI